MQEHDQNEDSKFSEAVSIVKCLVESGHEAVLAGGCVRDMLLGRTPKDYDIATSAPPDEVERLFERTKPVGKQFGVIIVLSGDESCEVATFRSESGYLDGRRPDAVEFADIEADVRRRDFTINAMYFDPLKERIIDLCGGKQDLENRLLRTIGRPEERFREDHLRLIRAVRFAARFQLTIEKETERAIKALSHLIEDVAPERLCEELRIILTDRAPAEALRLMDELGLLSGVFPELEACRGCEQPENYHPEGDVLTHSVLTVEKLGACPEFCEAVAALLHDIGKPEASRETPERFPEHERIGERITIEICRRLRMKKKEIERIAWLVRRHMYFKDVYNMKDSTLRRLFGEGGFEQLCRIARADALASWGRTDQVDYVLKKRKELRREQIQPEPLVDGHDLMALGYEQGPELGRMLEYLFDLQLEGKIETRQEALEIAQESREMPPKL